MGEVSTEVRESQSSGLLQQIIAASTNDAVDAGKMKAMADLAIQLQEREQVQQFQRDYIAAVMDMPVITKDGRIVIKDKHSGAVVQSTPFARFEDLDRMVRPIARKHNLGYTFEIGGELATGIKVRCVLRHANGHVERGDAMPLPLETSGSKNNVQGAGSSVSYGKRYTLQAAFSIVAEGVDTDGHDPSTVVTLPHEREQLVLAEAQEAHEAGRYMDWFNAQSPKDRAWLIGHGHHASFGGPALPAPTAAPPPSPPPSPPAQQGAGSAGTHAKRQQAGTDLDAQRADWVAKYVAKVDKVQTLDALDLLREEQAEKLQAIREGYPDLQRQIADAHERAMDRVQ